MTNTTEIVSANKGLLDILQIYWSSWQHNHMESNRLSKLLWYKTKKRHLALKELWQKGHEHFHVNYGVHDNYKWMCQFIHTGTCVHNWHIGHVKQMIELAICTFSYKFLLRELEHNNDLNDEIASLYTTITIELTSILFLPCPLLCCTPAE